MLDALSTIDTSIITVTRKGSSVSRNRAVMENTNRTRMEKRTREIFGRLKIIKDAKKNVAVI